MKSLSMSSKNIILIGFMGVGKGTIARALSKKTGLFAIDTDDLIESLENQKIKKIFAKHGEAYFRELEQKTALWLEKSVSNSIISTGGGFYKVSNLHQIGKVIYLKSSFEAIHNRLLSHPNSKAKLAKRPLFQDPKKAKKLYKVRIKEYEGVADFTLHVKNQSLKTSVNELCKLLEVEL